MTAIQRIRLTTVNMFGIKKYNYLSGKYRITSVENDLEEFVIRNIETKKWWSLHILFDDLVETYPPDSSYFAKDLETVIF